MPEFDLVPRDYRLRQMLRSRLRTGAIVLVCLIAVSGGAHLGLNYVSEGMKAEIDILKKNRSITARQIRQLRGLTDNRDTLQSQLSFLTGLRGGAEAPLMFVVVGRAMVEEEVWFESWEFKRAGFEVPRDERRSNGYFVTMPAVGGEKEQNLWKIETHMDVRGKAVDHAALSRFVARLFHQPEISDVRIKHSQLGSDGRFIEFSLVMTVDNSARETV
jgi:hypothetical protein